MTYKLQIICPDNQKTINLLIDAACEAGAGIIGNYTHNAFILHGNGQWKSEPGSNPTVGIVGKESHAREAKIEMHCPENKMRTVKKAIKKVHPYEEPVIEFIRMEDVS